MAAGGKRSSVFICYRVADSERYAKALDEELRRCFASEDVFFAPRSLAPGEDWEPRLEREVSQSGVVIALIGPEWARVADTYGRRRLDLPRDWVRREVETALKPTWKVHTIPLLVGVENLPQKEALDNLPGLLPLYGKQIHRLEEPTSPGWRQSVDQLIAEIERHGVMRRPAAAVAPGAVSVPRELELVYLRRLRDELREADERYAPLRGTARTSRPGAMGLLHRRLNIPSRLVLRSHPTDRQEPQADSRREFSDVLAAFAEIPRAVVLGAPGAGKSTTLGKLAADLAARAEADPAAPIPLLVRLGWWRGAESWDHFLAEHRREVGPCARDLSYANRLVVLLDGLNELPVGARADKVAAIRVFLGSGGNPEIGLYSGTRVFVSCRADDYTGALDLGLDTLTLAPLRPAEIRAVIGRLLDGADDGDAVGAKLFWDLTGDPSLADVYQRWLTAGGTDEEFWDDRATPSRLRDTIGYSASGRRERCVREPRSLLRLAANPFMLIMIIQVWAEQDGRLPKNRAGLFASFVRRLLSRERVPADDDSLVRRLADLAWQLQGRNLPRRAEEVDLGVLTVIARDEALRALGDESVLKTALDASILIGDDEVRFTHQLLQEHFTALAMRARVDDGQLRASELWPADRWWERSGWEESAVLLAGLYENDCTPAVRWLMDAQPEVAAQCILESGASIADRAGLFETLTVSWLPRLDDVRNEPAPEARAAVGRALGRLDLDKRKGVAVVEGVPDIDWVDITGGPFIYQGQPDRIESFRIARYPITNVQFAAFVADGGYTNEQWWRGMLGAEREPSAPRWDLPNHPREMVSWYEATAFCAWLSKRLGYPVELPSERQWDRAAAFTDGREYPWGNGYQPGYANIDETWRDHQVGPHYLSRTTPVGIYPDGASPEPERVFDLAGNVWEWCRDEYATNERGRRGEERSITRVVRGGSWYDNAGVARASFRFGNHPRNRFDGVGFRVVSASPML